MKQKKDLKTQAYLMIKNNITTAKYPPNSLLNEEKLQADLGFSRTPIREAVIKLEQEHLVSVLPKKGIHVAPLRLKDVESFYEVRILMEPYIIRNYGSKISKSDLLELQNRHKALLAQHDRDGSQTADFQQGTHEADDRLHYIIVNAADNMFFNNLNEQVFTHNARFGYVVGKYLPDRSYETILEHLNIIHSLQSGEWDAAADKLALHLTASKKSAFSLFANVDTSNPFDLWNMGVLS